MNDRGHVPVLLHEVLRYLDVAREGTYIDGTIGLGGHSLAILKQNPRASLIGLDAKDAAYGTEDGAFLTRAIPGAGDKAFEVAKLAQRVHAKINEPFPPAE